MKTDRKPRSTMRKAPLMASLTLACALMTGNAGAGIPVTDVGNMPNHIITQISSYLSQLEDIGEYAKEAERWSEKMREFQNALAKLDSMLSGNTMLFANQNMQKRPESYGMEHACPNPKGGSGFSLTSLFTALAPDFNKDLLTEQQRVCANIVTLQNMKYNELVDMLANAKKRQDEIKQVVSNSSGGDENTQQSAVVATQKLIATSMSELQYSQSRIQAYDGMIASLSEDQKLLAKRALKGQASILGTIVSTAALKTALTIAD